MVPPLRARVVMACIQSREKKTVEGCDIALPFRMTPMTGCITNEPNTTATSVARTNDLGQGLRCRGRDEP